MLDIQISLELETPDIQIGIDPDIPDIEIEVASGGDSYPTYEGEYEVEPKAFAETVLPTKNKLMTENVTVNEIRVQKVSAPGGGYVYYIGI